jgi:Flp pilus assembly protein TadG
MRDRDTRLTQGTSTVEMAIVLPLLLMLTFAIGEFGIAFTRWHALNAATREGARAGVVFRNPCVAGTVQTQVQTTVGTISSGAGLTTTPGVTVTGACGGTGTALTVVSTVAQPFVVLPGLAGLAPTITLRASATMRNE